MAEIHWLNPVNGNFDTASDWSGGVVPGRNDDAFLDTAGAPYTVTLTGPGAQIVSTLETVPTATLDIASGALDILNGATNGGAIIVERSALFESGASGAGDFINNGILTADNGGALILNNTVSNAGTISINSVGSVLYCAFPSILTDDGAIKLSGGEIAGSGAPNGPALLTNADNTIEGFGTIGGATKQGRRLLFTNEAAGVVDASDAKGVLEINVGKYTVTNAGLIEATNRGDCVIDSAVNNTGTLEAKGGTLTLDAVVTGRGVVELASGRVVIENAGAAEAVTFAGKKGVLELDQSQSFAGKVFGFSLKGKTELDLRDIGFVSANEATFSGTTASGVLTVTDGTHTAHVRLVGDYVNSTFVASSDGSGGVTIVDPTAQTTSPARFAAAMAMMIDRGAPGPFHPDAAWGVRQPMLAGPRVMMT